MDIGDSDGGENEDGRLRMYGKKAAAQKRTIWKAVLESIQAGASNSSGHDHTHSALKFLNVNSVNNMVNGEPALIIFLEKTAERYQRARHQINTVGCMEAIFIRRYFTSNS